MWFLPEARALATQSLDAVRRAGRRHDLAIVTALPPQQQQTLRTRFRRTFEIPTTTTYSLSGAPYLSVPMHASASAGGAPRPDAALESRHVGLRLRIAFGASPCRGRDVDRDRARLAASQPLFQYIALEREWHEWRPRLEQPACIQ